MGDLVKDVGLGEIVSTFEKLQQKEIGPSELARIRRHTIICERVAAALRSTAVMPIELAAVSAALLGQLSSKLLIEERLREFYDTKLPGKHELAGACLVEFGRYIEPFTAADWLRDHGIEPATIGGLAVFTQNFPQIDYGVIATGTMARGGAGGRIDYFPVYPPQIPSSYRKLESRRINSGHYGEYYRYLGFIK